jgi:hypothetical protein
MIYRIHLHATNKENTITRECINIMKEREDYLCVFERQKERTNENT